MKVKIGDKYYDSDSEPILLILSEADKIRIGNLPRNTNNYCLAHRDFDAGKLSRWMQRE